MSWSKRSEIEDLVNMMIWRSSYCPDDVLSEDWFSVYGVIHQNGNLIWCHQSLTDSDTQLLRSSFGVTAKKQGKYMRRRHIFFLLWQLQSLNKTSSCFPQSQLIYVLTTKDRERVLKVKWVWINFNIFEVGEATQNSCSSPIVLFNIGTSSSNPQWPTDVMSLLSLSHT